LAKAPSVNISSAIVATGNSPANSGSSRTRCASERNCHAKRWPGRGHRIKSRQREHRATLSIEIAGYEIKRVDQPLAETAEFLHADADSSITDCGFDAWRTRADVLICQFR
jgi:hypothetical protein